MLVHKCDRCGDLYDPRPSSVTVKKDKFLDLDLCPNCSRKLLEWLREEDYYKEKEMEKQTIRVEPLDPLDLKRLNLPKPLKGIKK